MGRRIAIIQGHPDPRGHHVGHALADAYATGAKAAGHEVQVIAVACLDVPVLWTKDDWENDVPPDPIRQAQQTIGWAEHLVIVDPLWLGPMPALLKVILDQVFRPGFALAKGDAGQMGKKLLSGKSARIVVTMGMPAWV